MHSIENLKSIKISVLVGTIYAFTCSRDSYLSQSQMGIWHEIPSQ